MIWDRHNKKITFFVVQDKENKNPSNFLTVTCTKEDAIEYAYTYLKIQHVEHFKLWCDLRELDYNSKEAWNLYSKKCLTTEDLKRYIIRKITYTFNELTAILRMFGNCPPLGCSFDTPTEYSYLKYKLETQKLASYFSNAIKEAMDKKENKEEAKEDGKQ